MTSTGIAWLDARRAAFDTAVRSLKARCILVQQVSREMHVATYRISGRWGQYLAEDVIELAERLDARDAAKDTAA